MKEWHFYDKVYRRWVVVLIGDRESFIQHLKDDGYKHMDGMEEWVSAAQGVHMRLDFSNNDIGNTCHLVWLKKYDLNTLIHELSHLVISVFDTCGIEYDHDNQEVFAFYLEFWFNEIRKAIREHPKGLPPTKVRK